MRTIFILLLSTISAIAADTPIAIVHGTNVVFVCIADTNRFVPKAGMSNIVITTAELSVITKGWSYSGGVFRDSNGAGLPASVVAKKDRETKAKAFVAKYNERKADWYTLKVAEQGDVLGRLCALIEAILELHPELLEPKETSQ